MSTGESHAALATSHQLDSGALRRSIDVAIACLLVALLLPVCVLIAMAIALEGAGGGVVFSQTRIGKGGRRFHMLKFRTMRPTTHHVENPVPLRQRRDDPRCTHVGRLLRASHLDELPQLLNVLAGDMALIGPRPLVPEEDALVTEAWPGRRNHLPGITGAWQVQRSDESTVDELIRLEQAYLSRPSWRRDATVLARTLCCVARRSGR